MRMMEVTVIVIVVDGGSYGYDAVMEMTMDEMAGMRMRSLSFPICKVG